MDWKIDVCTSTLGQPAEGHSGFRGKRLLLSDDDFIHAFVLRRPDFWLFSMVRKLLDDWPRIINPKASHFNPHAITIGLVSWVWKCVLDVETCAESIINAKVTWFDSNWWKWSRWSRRETPSVNCLRLNSWSLNLTYWKTRIRSNRSCFFIRVWNSRSSLIIWIFKCE